MPLLVTSASSTNGDGFGALLAFELDGRFRGTFTEDDRIADRIEGLNPGGGNFGQDGRYYVGSRSARTIVTLSTSLNGAPSMCCHPKSYLFLEVLLSVLMVGCFSLQESVPTAKAITP